MATANISLFADRAPSMQIMHVPTLGTQSEPSGAAVLNLFEYGDPVRNDESDVRRSTARFIFARIRYSPSSRLEVRVTRNQRWLHNNERNQVAPSCVYVYELVIEMPTARL